MGSTRRNPGHGEAYGARARRAPSGSAIIEQASSGAGSWNPSSTSDSPALLGRLAAALDLASDGPMLMGQAGERAAFSCAGFTHHVAPDASSIEFSDQSELAGQWINAVQVVTDRDRRGNVRTLTSTPPAAGGGENVASVRGCSDVYWPSTLVEWGVGVVWCSWWRWLRVP